MKGNLYLIGMDEKSHSYVSGNNPLLVGKELFDLKDSDGKYHVREMIKTAQAGGDWVDYKWPAPETKEIRPKSTYVEKVGGLILGCGIYK